MVIKNLPQKASEAWTLGREIGHGAYGTVHLATGPKGQVAAVKVCRREAMDRDRYERELRGARLYKSIQMDERDSSGCWASLNTTGASLR